MKSKHQQHTFVKNIFFISIPFFLLLATYNSRGDKYNDTDLTPKWVDQMVASVTDKISKRNEVYFQKGQQIFEKFDEVKLSFDENMEILDTALFYFIESNCYDMQVAVLGNKGAISYYEGDFMRGEDFIEAAYTLAIKELPPDNQYYLEAMHNRAIFHELKGQYKKAENLYFQVLSLEKELENTGPISLAKTYNALGGMYFEKGDYYNALEYHKKTVLLIERTFGVGDKEEIPFRVDLGNALMTLTKYDEAKASYFQAMNSISCNNLISDKKYIKQSEFYSLMGLAKIYLHENKLDSFLLVTKDAMLISESFEIEFDAYSIDHLLGKMYLKTGQDKKSLHHLQEAYQALEKELGGIKKDPNLSLILVDIAKAESQRALLDQSLKTYQNALAGLCPEFQSDDYKDNPDITMFFNVKTGIEVLNGKAEALNLKYEKTNNIDYLKAAHHTYQRINELVSELRNSFYDINSQYQLADNLTTVFEEAIGISYDLYKITGDPQYIKAAFKFSASNKACVMQSKINFTKRLSASQVPDRVVDRLEYFRHVKLNEEKTLYDMQRADNLDVEKIEKSKEKIFDVSNNYDLFYDSLKTFYPEVFAQNLFQQDLSIESLQTSIGNNELLIEYFYGKDALYIFSLDNDCIEFHEISKPAELDDKIVALKELLKNSADTEDAFIKKFETFRNHAHFLYNQLLSPALDAVIKEIEKIKIIPDGELNNLPFEVLITNPKQENPEYYFHTSNLSYLLEDYIISYDYASALFLQNKTNTRLSNKKSVLGFAPKFPDLQLNIKEVDTISAILGGAVITGEEATKAAFLRNLNKYAILHLSTHGAYNKGEEAYSTSIQFYDTEIYNYEIEQLKIGADVVVLSACETSAGKNVNGEGVISLSRSFSIAGCPTVIANLWKVNEGASAEVMKLFYTQLKSVTDIDVALSNAKLKYIEQSGWSKSDPYYWASFMLTGKTML